LRRPPAPPRSAERQALADLPEWGRLRVATKIRGTHLQIVEIRLTPFRMTMANWIDEELAIAVVLSTVEMRLPASFADSVQILAAVGLHALGRRYERGDRRDPAVLRDLIAFSGPA
jgi:hypothetical protein